jgi:hypothetical protein
LEEYKEEKIKEVNPMISVLRKSVSHKIITVSDSGEYANVAVEVTFPDITLLVKDFMGTAFSSALAGKNEAEIHRAFAAKYENAAIPTTTRKEQFRLHKEDGAWKVFLDWKHEKEEKGKAFKVEKLLADAANLRKERRFYESIEKYEQALALNGELVSAKTAVDSVKKEIQETEKKQSYLKNVTLYDLKSGYYKTYSDDRVPGVSFKLKNNGDRSLRKINVTVYFKDSNDTIIYEKEFSPVVDSPYSFGENRGPLKPNYIWSIGQDKFYKAEAVPTEWKEGSVSARITDIEFAD